VKSREALSKSSFLPSKMVVVASKPIPGSVIPLVYVDYESRRAVYPRTRQRTAASRK
jgi:hypothetical protein